jgi:hypothetical protein
MIGQLVGRVVDNAAWSRGAPSLEETSAESKQRLKSERDYSECHVYAA